VAKPETKNGISCPGLVSFSGIEKEKTRVTIGGAELPSIMASRPPNRAVKAFLSGLRAISKPTSVVNVGPGPNVASLVTV
jgi:hypothetical protein